MIKSRISFSAGLACKCLFMALFFAGTANAEIVYFYITTGNLERLKEVPDEKLRELETPGLNDASPLGVAALTGRSEFVSFLLAKGANPNFRSFEGLTPLHFAVSSKWISVKSVRLLLDKGADPNLRDQFKRTPLMAAALNEDTSGEIERILLPITTVTDEDIAFLEIFVKGWKRDGPARLLEILTRKIAMIQAFRKSHPQKKR